MPSPDAKPRTRQSPNGPAHPAHPAQWAARPAARLGAPIAAGVLAADQLTKWWMLDHVLRTAATIEMAPFFNLVTAWNRGISFGLLRSEQGWTAWALSTLAVVIAAVLAWWLWRTRSRPEAAALGLIIGGAIGNVVDRIRFGAVFDFLDFHAFGHHWPAFNVADSAISCGAVALVSFSLFVGRERLNT